MQTVSIVLYACKFGQILLKLQWPPNSWTIFLIFLAPRPECKTRRNKFTYQNRFVFLFIQANTVLFVLRIYFSEKWIFFTLLLTLFIHKKMFHQNWLLCAVDIFMYRLILHVLVDVFKDTSECVCKLFENFVREK